MFEILLLAQVCVGPFFTQRDHHNVHRLFWNRPQGVTRSSLDSLLKVQGRLVRTESQGKTTVYQWQGCSPDKKPRGFEVKFRGRGSLIWKGYGF